MNIFVSMLTLLLFSSQNLVAYNVGLMIMATGKYIEFVKPLIESAKQHFCPGHNVTFFVFTDSIGEENENVIYIPQTRLGWPYDTMMRFQIYCNNKEYLLSQDYLFSTDADMLFVNTVGDEILSDRVGTQHPGFVSKRGSYETSPLSKAYVSPQEGEIYFAGGFYGGSSKEVIRMANAITKNILDDLDQGYIAVWHDESHLNRYFIDHKPTKVLDPSYCYPESWDLPYPKRLLALDKNHQQFRE